MLLSIERLGHGLLMTSHRLSKISTIQEANTIKQILNNFCSISGQTPNWNKSSILFSKQVADPLKIQLKDLFPVPDLQPNTIHLGHPLIINQADRIQAYDFIYHKFKNKLTTLKANKLNHAGRLAYIQSVFASIPVYYMAHVLLTKKLLGKITAIIRNFWWAEVQEEDASQPLHLRAWEDICRDKAQGGLGIKRIDLFARAIWFAGSPSIRTDLLPTGAQGVQQEVPPVSWTRR
ncbi:unnamed protein product [Urochloa humidicola]